MCVTFAPAKLSGTTILTGTIDGGTRRYLHYRNTAEGVTLPSGRRNGGFTAANPLPSAWNFGSSDKPSLVGLDNCLAFPVFGQFESIQSLEAGKASQALDAVEKAIKSLYPQMMSFSPDDMTRSAKGFGNDVRILVTELYTTILAKDPARIPGVLEELGAAEDLCNAAAAEQFKRAYPNVPFALSLFANGAAKKGGLLLTFEPLAGYESVYFIPTLDGHGALDFGANVDVDHIIAVGTQAKGRSSSYDFDNVGTVDATSADAAEVSYFGADEKVPADVKECLPKNVIGVELAGTMANGDIIVDKSSADKGIWKARRVAPPGLSAPESKLVDKPISISGPYGA